MEDCHMIPTCPFAGFCWIRKFPKIARISKMKEKMATRDHYCRETLPPVYTLYFKTNKEAIFGDISFILPRK